MADIKLHLPTQYDVRVNKCDHFGRLQNKTVWDCLNSPCDPVGSHQVRWQLPTARVGKVFRSVCQSFCSLGGSPVPEGSLLPRGREAGLCSQMGSRNPTPSATDI